MLVNNEQKHKSSQERLAEVAERRDSLEAQRLSRLSNQMGMEADRMEHAQVLREMNLDHKKEVAHQANQAVQDVHDRREAVKSFLVVPATPTPSEVPTETTTPLATIVKVTANPSRRDSKTTSVSLTDLRAEAVAERRDSLSSLHCQEQALERELSTLKNEYAQLAHDANIESTRQKARLSNVDVDQVRARHAIQEKIDECVAHAKKHDLELKGELAEAIHHDKLMQVKEKQAELRHVKA